MPDRPDWVNDPVSVELWDKFGQIVHGLGLLESLDAIAFGLLCDAIASLMDMRENFARNPDYLNTVGENGALQINPLCQLIAQQTKGVLTLAAEFGMTPRGRVNLTGSLTCIADAAALDPMEQLLREITKPLPGLEEPPHVAVDASGPSRTTRTKKGKAKAASKRKRG